MGNQNLTAQEQQNNILHNDILLNYGSLISALLPRREKMEHLVTGLEYHRVTALGLALQTRLNVLMVDFYIDFVQVCSKRVLALHLTR
jgi:hypothetical protein